jgi:hypothetical protein
MEEIMQRQMDGRREWVVVLMVSNRLLASWAYKWRGGLFILDSLTCQKVCGAAFIVGIDQIFHFDTLQAVKPPIERDIIHEQPGATLCPRHACI